VYAVVSLNAYWGNLTEWLQAAFRSCACLLVIPCQNTLGSVLRVPHLRLGLASSGQWSEALLAVSIKPVLSLLQSALVLSPLVPCGRTKNTCGKLLVEIML
jgi:hypothetical protein